MTKVRVQGTLALELLEQVQERLDAIIVCVSGGGMISGVATAAKGLDPDITILAAEPSGEGSVWVCVGGHGCGGARGGAQGCVQAGGGVCEYMCVCVRARVHVRKCMRTSVL